MLLAGEREQEVQLVDHDARIPARRGARNLATRRARHNRRLRTITGTG
jgi:hypothetical protein